MSVNPSYNPNTETEYHNRTPEGVDDLRGLLMRLQMKEMTPMNPGKDSHPQRQKLYEQFALVAMLIKNQTPETRIQFIDIARLLKPDIYPSIDKDHIVKILVKWIILKPKAEQLQKNPQFMSVVYDLLYFMEQYQHTQKHIYQYIPIYYHYNTFDEIDSPISLTGYISMPVSQNKSLRIRDTCLELAMTLKDPDKIRVKFLDLAYYFEPIFRKTSLQKYSENDINSYILDQWKIILTLIDRVNQEPKNNTSSKTMLNVLQHQMKSYTDTLSQSRSYTAPMHAQTVQNTHNYRTHNEQRHYPKRGYAVWPTNNTQNTTQNRTYPRVLPYKLWSTRNEIASQEPASHLTGPVDQVRPCRCRGCTGCDGKPGHCRCIGRCRCVHDADTDAREV